MVTIEETVIIRAPRERCFDLARSVEVHLAGNVHWGEQAIAAGGVTSGLIGLADRVTWRARHFLVWHTLTSEIVAMDPPAYFRDRQIAGPFALMEHDHYFRALSPHETEMRDVFRFAAPLPVLGRIAEAVVLRRYMRRLLHERTAVLKQIAEAA